MTMVPVRWRGSHSVKLRAVDGQRFDAAGKPITRGVLNPGDTLMVPAAEAFGQTIKWDPQELKDPLYLGVGRVVLPEDAGKSDAELAVLGYEFQLGRADPAHPGRDMEALVEPKAGIGPGDGAPQDLRLTLERMQAEQTAFAERMRAEVAQLEFATSQERLAALGAGTAPDNEPQDAVAAAVAKSTRRSTRTEAAAAPTLADTTPANATAEEAAGVPVFDPAEAARRAAEAENAGGK